MKLARNSCNKQLILVSYTWATAINRDDLVLFWVNVLFQIHRTAGESRQENNNSAVK